MSKKTKQIEDRLVTIVESGGIGYAAHYLAEMLDEEEMLTAEEKAPYKAALDGLWSLAIDRGIATYKRTLTTKKGN